MIENKISLSPTIKLPRAAHMFAPQGLNEAFKSIRAKITVQACAIFACLMAAYFLSSKSYQLFVTPYRDLWPADFKVIAVLLIVSPAFLLSVRELFGDRAGTRSRRNGLLALLCVNCLFIGAMSVRRYWNSPPLSMDDLRPVLWAGVWLVTPFVVVEISRALSRAAARAVYPSSVLLATPASIRYLDRDAGIASVMGSSFDCENIYGLGAAAALADVAVRGDLTHLADSVCNRGLRKIVVASLKREIGLVENVARNLMPLAIDVYSYAIDEDGASGGQLRLVLRRPLTNFGLALKGFEDFCLGAVLTFFFAPLLGFIALAIKFDSPGPVFFKQKRHGYRHQEIEVFKFRTMRTDRLDYGCAQQTLRGDPRITRVGQFLRKSSLDELPQLLNVIRGEMSLVGPRPHAITMRTAQKLSHEIVPHYAHRHCVKPGITGWAQVNGCRGAMDVEDDLVNRVKFDMEYIAKWSVVFDFYILFKTIFHLAGTKNSF